ncbi:MAG: bifunctional diguanylate cyclase/phosphodiesterase [Clostridiales bacterium]|nr:bifunctional diguanylate cyclase/phosphodiesterase [Clostridiales bacterium]
MRMKVQIVVIIPIVLGVVTFLDGGFSSGTTILMSIGNAAAMLLLRKRVSNVIAAGTILSFIGLWIWTHQTGFDATPDMIWTKWMIQFLLLILFLFIFRISVYAIKKYLVENIESLEESVKLTKQLAYYDALTGLPNYNYFFEYLGELESNSKPCGIIMIISLKNLNMINDLYGNEKGNQILIETGKILNKYNQNCELAARVNSNEFSIWIQDVPGKAEAEVRRNHILSNLNREFEIGGTRRHIEFYASFAEVNFQNETCLNGYQKAQIALTYAKYSGIDKLVSYDKNFEYKIKRLTELKELLKTDIMNHENIAVFYQPQFATKTEEIVSVEALARWRTDIYGCVSPIEFIPIVEELDLHEKFGLYILKNAFSDYEEIEKKYGKDTRVSVNISPAFLMTPDFTQNILDLLEESNFSPENLTLEITEEIVLEGVDMVNEKLSILRKKGVRVSLDDFGTGFSSLSYLARLEVDELKLDKSLIDQITTSHKSNILIGTLIQLSRQYHMIIVAEGVETKEQYDMLRDMGCTLIQGYYIGKAEKLS